MISFNNVTLEFGGKPLFQEISFFFSHKDRIGLVGRNGAGKSTLFKLILGQISPTSGAIAKQGDVTIGHLKQELGALSGTSIFEEAKTAFNEIALLEERIEEINHGLVTRTDYESESYLQLCDDLAKAEERFAMLGGDQREKNIGTILKGLGFKESDFHKEISTFSGGWQMRVELAKILLQKPDVLLLDEPTNHLDIDSIQWLERFLKNYPGAIILISHDRDFLDAVTNRTIEISNRRVYDYNVAYTKYKEQRAERMLHQSAAAMNQQKKIDDLERFVERFKAKASKAKQAQSKLKAINKIDRIEVDTEENIVMNFYFPPAPRAGALPFEAVKAGKSYGSKKVLSNVNFEIERGDRIAFIGKNGMGKSTLTKMLMQLIDHEGAIKVGHNTLLGYFAQDNISELNPNKTAFQIIDDEATGEMRTKVRSLLGAFLFTGEDVDKKIKVLSGGEKSRLSLAKLLLKEFNFLILDEPTNHLDMQSKDILKEALLKFNGTYVVVSHDREFLRGLCTKVFEFTDNTVKVHLGDVDEYLLKKQTDSIEDSIKDNSLRAASESQHNKPADSKEDYEQRKELSKKKNKLEKSLKKLEEDIERLEREQKQIEEHMAKPNFAELSNKEIMFKRYEEIKLNITQMYHRWDDISAEIEEFA